MALKYCMSCGKEVQPGTRFCKSCGQNLIDQDAQKDLSVLSPSAMSVEPAQEPSLFKANGHYSQAVSSTGEMIFTQVFAAQSSASIQNIGPFKRLWRTFGNGLSGFVLGFKDLRILIPALLLIGSWVGLAYLNYYGIEHTWINYIGIAIFAEGGSKAGIAGLIGGVFGKAAVGGVIILFLSQLLSLKNPFKGLFKSIGFFFKSIVVKNLKDLSGVLMGLGCACILYNFMSGETSVLTIAAGFAGFILSMKTLTGVNRLMAGLSLGFLIAVGLSLSPQVYLLYIIGGIAMVLGLVVYVLGGLKKGVKNNG